MKEVNKEQFWKERLDNATNFGRLHYSVFISGDKLWKQIEREHIKILEKEVLPTDKVLDAGCGYGRASEFIKGEYVGVDLSPDLIAKAQELYPHRKFVVGKLESLPFKDKEFDVGFCISVKAMIVANLGQEAWNPMEKELKRVCKKVLLLEYGCSDADSYLDADKYEII
jgi:SAM-dependent methyltransferase